MSFGHEARPSTTMADTRPAVMIAVDDKTGAILGEIGVSKVDLAVVHVLMRLALRERRRGHRVRLLDVPEELRALLELVGLDRVLALEPRRQPELLEDVRADEVVEPGDGAV
jgi:ABC-type transporter Mla MlaB component